MENSPNIEIRKPGYTIVIFSGNSDPLNEDDDNVDVQVTLDDGSYYTATFFTLVNINRLFDKNKQTGECGFGLYFFSSDMIIVEKLNPETVERVVSELMDEGEMGTAFVRHSASE